MTYLYVFSKTKQFLEEEMDHWRFFKFLFDVIHFLLTAVLYKEWPTILTNSWLLHMLNFCGIESLVTYIMLCFSVTQPSCGIKIFLAVSFSHLFSSFCKSFLYQLLWLIWRGKGSLLKREMARFKKQQMSCSHDLSGSCYSKQHKLIYQWMEHIKEFYR